MSLRNDSNKPVEFRYILLLLEHVDVFTRRGKRVDFKLNGPSFESATASIPLKPRETFRSVEKIPLSVWYDLDPGDYYLIFRYDLRLLPDTVMKIYRKKLHSEDWVVWDSKKYWFHIYR